MMPSLPADPAPVPETVEALLSAQLDALQQTAEAQQAELRRLRAEADALRAESAALRAERDAAQAGRERAEAEVAAMRGSTSWRISAPLRWFRRRVA